MIKLILLLLTLSILAGCGKNEKQLTISTEGIDKNNSSTSIQSKSDSEEKENHPSFVKEKELTDAEIEIALKQLGKVYENCANRLLPKKGEKKEGVEFKFGKGKPWAPVIKGQIGTTNEFIHYYSKHSLKVFYDDNNLVKATEFVNNHQTYGRETPITRREEYYEFKPFVEDLQKSLREIEYTQESKEP